MKFQKQKQAIKVATKAKFENSKAFNQATKPETGIKGSRTPRPGFDINVVKERWNSSRIERINKFTRLKKRDKTTKRVRNN